MNDYNWPCDLRIAHGPHDIRNERLSDVLAPGDLPFRKCPGVQAHPNTMIGRNQR